VVDGERMEAWKGFLRAHAALVATLEDELQRERGLSLTDYEVLLFLSRAPEGAMRMQELAHSVLLSKSGVTRLVDRLERKGFVMRGACPGDRRGTMAVITPEGRREFEAAAPVHLSGVERHFAAHLEDDEVEVLRAALTRLIDANRPSPPAADRAS
jgi:DNA-binding MarR family transcriptional regulator